MCVFRNHTVLGYDRAVFSEKDLSGKTGIKVGIVVLTRIGVVDIDVCIIIKQSQRLCKQGFGRDVRKRFFAAGQHHRAQQYQHEQDGNQTCSGHKELLFKSI